MLTLRRPFVGPLPTAPTFTRGGRGLATGGASFHAPGPTHLMGRKVGSRGTEGHPPGRARCPPHAPSTGQAFQVPIFTLPPLLWLDGAHSRGDSFWPSPRGWALCHGQDQRVTRSWCNAGVAGLGGAWMGRVRS